MPGYYVDVSIHQPGPRGGQGPRVTKTFFVSNVPNPGDAVLEGEKRMKTHFETTVRRAYKA